MIINIAQSWTAWTAKVSLLTTRWGCWSLMGNAALRVASEVLLQSNKNILLHFNALSKFVSHR